MSNPHVSLPPDPDPLDDVAAIVHDGIANGRTDHVIAAQVLAARPAPAPDTGLREALLLAVEEVDNCWNDQADHIEWDSDVLPERLIALRQAYAALADSEDDPMTADDTRAPDPLRECGLYDPAMNMICASPFGHDNGAHTALGMERLAFREADERKFQARKHEGKNPYPSKQAAKRAAAMTTTTFGGARKMAYRCPTCGWFHVGATR